MDHFYAKVKMQVQGTMDANDCKDLNDNVLQTKAADAAELEEGMEILRKVEMKVTDSTDSVDGRAPKEQGQQATVLEMKTFKRYSHSLSQYDHLEEATEEDPLKIVCVGGCTGGVLSKGIFIKDYLGIKPGFRVHPFNSIDCYLKRADWRRYGGLKNYYSVVLQLSEISDLERFSAMTKVFFQHSKGAVVFWGPRHPPSLAEAVKWRTKINQEVCSPIPCVLVTENVMDSCANSVKWIGPGKIFESELALNQFCKDHRFAGHFEITSRDWQSGEKSVFGQAVNRLLDEILQGDEKEDSTRM